MQICVPWQFLWAVSPPYPVPEQGGSRVPACASLQGWVSSAGKDGEVGKVQICCHCMQPFRVFSYTWDWNLFFWHWPYRINIDSRAECPTYIFPFESQQKCTSTVWAPSRRKRENFVILFFLYSLNSTIKYLFLLLPLFPTSASLVQAYCSAFILAFFFLSGNIWI